MYILANDLYDKQRLSAMRQPSQDTEQAEAPNAEFSRPISTDMR